MLSSKERRPFRLRQRTGHFPNLTQSCARGVKNQNSKHQYQNDKKVADVDDEDGVGGSLWQISKLRFGHKVKLLFRL